MEAILASTADSTDVLPPSLKYGIDPTGSFVTAKNERTVFALGSSYSPSGVKLLQIPFGSTTEWLVPESVVFSANFKNNSGTEALWPASPDANCLFERIDIRLGGNLVESVTESARVNQLLTNLTMSPQKKLNSAQMGFGTNVPSATDNTGWSAAFQHTAALVDAHATTRIHWKCNLSGLLSQHRWLPLYALSGQGLTVSFFLAPGADSTIKSFGGTTYSQDYTLTEVKAHCTMCTIADELMESFQSQLLAGNPIRIPIKKLESMYSYVPTSATTSKFSIPMTRNYTRLAALFASFVQEPPADGSGKNKLCNSFYVHTASRETLAYNLQVGSRRIPDNDVVGFGESWYRLLNAIGIGGSLSHASGITYADYATNSYALCVDLEKIPHLSSSGENVSNVGQITLNISGFGTVAADLPSRCHLLCQTDAVIELRDTTVELFE